MPHKIVGWGAYYKGHEVYDSASIAWEELPEDGALMFMLYQDERDPTTHFPLRRCMTGSDFYFKEGEVYGHNDSSLEENLRRYPEAILKRGMWTTEEEYEWARKTSTKDRFIP